MIDLALLMLLVFAGLSAVLATVAALVHSGFYEQPVEGIAWRAPAAAAAITGFLMLWAYLHGRMPDRFDSLFRFSASADQQLEQFWSERQLEGGTQLTLFRRRIVPPGRVDYIDASGKAWRRSDSGVVTAILIEENGERRRFAAQLSPEGAFICDPRDPNTVMDVRYVEEGGRQRVMTEGAIGTLSNPRYGALIVNTLFNLAFLAVWIVVVGLAFQLEWFHAFVIGSIGWVTTLLMIWPVIQAGVPIG